MSQLKTYGIVLQYTDFSETSRMLTLFTPGLGLVRASSKGCKRPKSPLYAGCELYCFAEYVLSESRGNYTLTQADGVESFYGIRTDLDALAAAAQMAEFTIATAVEGGEAPAQFILLSRCLERISDYPTENPYMLSLYYQMQTLCSEGMLPDFQHCANCGRPASSAPEISAQAGGRICHTCRSLYPDTAVLSPGTWKMLELLRTSPIEMVPRLKFTRLALRETEKIWPILAASIIEKKLRSTIYIAGIKKHRFHAFETDSQKGEN